MAQTALEKLEALKAEYEGKVSKVKSEALEELKAKLSEARKVVQGIEAQIAEITGRTVVAKTKVFTKRTTRMNKAAIEAYAAKLVSLLPRKQSEAWAKSSCLAALDLPDSTSWMSIASVAKKTGMVKFGSQAKARYYRLPM